jgi:hypothetical protein
MQVVVYDSIGDASETVIRDNCLQTVHHRNGNLGHHSDWDAPGAPAPSPPIAQFMND